MIGVMNMPKVVLGRFAARMEGPFVVFIIGMRVNRFFAFQKWVPVARAMGPMIKELYNNPETGFLSTEFFFNWRGITLVQYWKSYEHLEKYARGGIHLTAWKKFNQSVGTDGTVGIYHESYIIESGKYESVYGNMPKFGLAKAGEHVPATGKMETARKRLGGDNVPAVPTPGNPQSN
jgi:hypothetical protein